MNTNNSSNTVTRLGGQALYVLLGNVFTLVVGFPLQVYVARVLGAESLGIFGLFDAAFSLTANLLGFGLAQSLVKFIPQCLAERDHAGVRLLARRGFQLLLLGGALAVLVVWLLLLLDAPIAPMLEHPAMVFVMVLLVPFSVLGYFLQQGLQAFHNVRYVIMGIAFLQLSIKAVLTVVLLEAGFGMEGYAVAIVVATLGSLLWMTIGFWRMVAALPATQTQANDNHWRPQWRSYAAVMYSESLLGIGVSYIDRFLLGLLSGASLVGVLMLVKQLYILPAVFFQMFMSIAGPMFSAAHASGDINQRQHIYHLITDWVTRLSAPLCLFLLIFAEPILDLYGSDIAEEGVLPLRILIAGQMFNQLMGPLGSMLSLNGYEKLMFKLAVVEQVLVIAGYFLLVPRFGINGVAFMIAFGVVEQNTVAYVVARRKLGLRWFDRRFLQWLWPGAATLVTGLWVHWYLEGQLGAIALIAVLMLFYAVFLLVSLMQGLHADDKTMLTHITKRLLPGR